MFKDTSISISASNNKRNIVFFLDFLSRILYIIMIHYYNYPKFISEISMPMLIYFYLCFFIIIQIIHKLQSTNKWNMNLHIYHWYTKQML